MNPHPHEVAVLEITELSSLCGLSAADLGELLEYGALKPLPAGDGTSHYDAMHVAPLREAARLRELYDLDLFTVSLLLGYLHRIDELERQLRSLHAQVPRHTADREGPASWREPHA